MSDKADLRCAGCGKHLGDNNAQITLGPHASARPTDLTTFCPTTRKQESVLDTMSKMLTDYFPDGILVETRNDEIVYLSGDPDDMPH